ncbi:MAG: DMT family transporter [Bacteroidia bacterium]|nr:DMT family transporter [Bacteroidia bacterium]
MKNKAAIAVIIGALLAGLSGFFIKSADLPPASYAFFRTTVPAVLMALWMLSQGIRFLRGNYKLMLLGSAFNAARMYFFFMAYIMTSIGNAVLISYTWPIFATLLSALILKETVSRRNIFLLFLAFSGIVLVYINKPFSFENDDFIGMSAALASAALYACSIIIFKKEADGYTRNELLFYQNLVSVFVFLPFVLLQEPPPELHDIGIASAHGFLLGTVGFAFFFYGLKYLPASTASGLTYIEVVAALLLSIFWMKEELTLNMLAGGAIILISTSLLRSKKKEEAEN